MDSVRELLGVPDLVEMNSEEWQVSCPDNEEGNPWESSNNDAPPRRPPRKNRSFQFTAVYDVDGEFDGAEPTTVLDDDEFKTKMKDIAESTDYENAVDEAEPAEEPDADNDSQDATADNDSLVSSASLSERRAFESELPVPPLSQTSKGDESVDTVTTVQTDASGDDASSRTKKCKSFAEEKDDEVATSKSEKEETEKNTADVSKKKVKGQGKIKGSIKLDKSKRSEYKFKNSWVSPLTQK
jgi:hypothetical protein